MYTGLQTNCENVFSATFSSWGAFVDEVEKRKWYSCTPSWAGGTRSLALRLAREGWKEQTPVVTKLAQKVANRVVQHSAMAEHVNIVYDVAGAAYDPGAYIAGVPECWVAFAPTNLKRAVRIVVDGTISASVKKHKKIVMGSAICALVMALHGEGHPVTVDLFFGGVNGESTYIRLHDAAIGGVLDVDRLVYALAHPLPMRGMAHTLWGRGVMPYSRNDHPADTKGDFDLWVGGGHINDVTKWADNGESWVTDQFIAQTTG